MEDVEEREIAGLTIQIDRLLCVGFGDCIDVAPSAFEFDEEGIAVFREEAAGVGKERIMEACRRCPVDALVVIDENGDRLIP